MAMQEKKFQQELWSTIFGFYYYNDHEIFVADEHELESQAKRFADAGINHVMTFSVTHFRWSFQSSWTVIDRALNRIVKAFHKYNIKVTEHHSANFIFMNPADPAVRKIINLKFACRNSTLDNWPSFEADHNLERDVGDGIIIKSLLQVDGVTGKPICLEYYKTYYMCPNNPDYVRLYLKYLEEHIYPQGVDGIMTDDISCRCACKHCRKLFSERTEFELPAHGQAWAAWLKNVDSPAYRAWLKFRLDSCNDFHLAVKTHYENLGLRLLRPNYISTAITFTHLPSLQSFDNLPALDWAFQENNYSDIIRYSWPEWRVEAGHRRMVARNKGIPSMSMFYPERQDVVDFSWALAMSWGNKYVGTTHNADIDPNSMEKTLRKFEIKHANLLNETRSIAKLAFYDSYTNRIIYNGYNSRSAKLASGWIQACTHHNIQWEMINKHDLTQLNNYSIIVLPEVAALEADELKCFQTYVRNGGHIIWLGNCAVLDENGQKRSKRHIADLIGIPHFANALSTSEANSFQLGEGTIKTFSLEAAMLWNETRKTIHQRWNKEGIETRLPLADDTFISAQDKKKRLAILELLTITVPGIQVLQCKNAPEDLLVTGYTTSNGDLAVHIVNATDTLTPGITGTLGHNDGIPLPKLINEVTITLIIHNAAKFTSATLLQPEKNDLKLTTKCTSDIIEVILPKQTINYYGLIHFESSDNINNKTTNKDS